MKVSGHNTTCSLKEVDLTTSNSNLVETQTYRLWRLRMMVFMMLGYAAFYFVRSNLSFALPGMEAELGFTKRSSVGLFPHSALYTVSENSSAA